MKTRTRLTTLTLALIVAALYSVALHETLHCIGAGNAPWACNYSIHYHDTGLLGLDHVANSSHYTPGDHAWIVPTQLAYLFVSGVTALITLQPRTTV